MWTARGVVQAAYLPRQQPVGTVVDRSWLFERRCAAPGNCVLRLVRQAQFGTEMATVTQEGTSLVASFTNIDDDSCIAGVHGTVQRHFKIELGSDGTSLHADEIVNADYPGCGPSGTTAHPTGQVTWTATRTAAPADDTPAPNGTSA